MEGAIAYLVGLFLMTLFAAYTVGSDGRDLNFEGVLGRLLCGALWPILVPLFLVAVPIAYFHQKGKKSKAAGR